MSTENPIPASVLTYLDTVCRGSYIRAWYGVNFLSEIVRIGVMIGSSFVIGGVVRVARHEQSPTWADFLPLLIIAAVLRIIAMFLQFLREVAWLHARKPMEMNGYAFLFRHTLDHSHRYFADHPAGKVAHKIAELPWVSMQFFDAICTRILPATATLVIAVVALFPVHPLLGGVMLVWMIPATLWMLVAARTHARLATVRSETRGALSGAIVDSISNNQSVRLFARSAHEADHMETFIDRHRAATHELVYDNQRIGFVRDIPITILFVALTGCGVWLYLQGTLGLDGLTTLLTICAIVVSYTEDIVFGTVSLIESHGTIAEGLSLLSLPYDVKDDKDARPLRVWHGEIVLDHLGFSYPDNTLAVLNDLNLRILPGQKVGLIGRSGAGKTTLFGLLSRAYEPSCGTIRIDGQDISHATLQSLRAQIAVIPQDTALFHRPLIENIRYGRVEASDAEVLEAARLAHCDEFVSKLPEGYNTWVGERGVKLSGGQRQRIAIARAILKNAPILLLDEATSALDSESEHLVQSSLIDLMRGRTVIAIAHRLSTIAHLDRLIIMAQGRVVEDGSHKDLLAQNGLYADLWRRQSGGFIMEEPAPPPEQAMHRE